MSSVIIIMQEGGVEAQPQRIIYTKSRSQQADPQKDKIYFSSNLVFLIIFTIFLELPLQFQIFTACLTPCLTPVV